MLVGDTLDRDPSISHTIPPARRKMCISWKPTPPKWVTLNSDGSVLETGDVAIGDLFKDHQGCCLASFTVNLGRCSITRAELRGVVSHLRWLGSYVSTKFNSS
ncbi:hypothetical protein LINPERPRIM_LOCUS31510 [Linum perenne]